MKISKLFFISTLFFYGTSITYAQRAGDQGVGVMIGNPSGFSYKIWLDNNFGLDGAVGVNQGEFDIHATLLYHNFETARNLAADSPFMARVTANGDLPWYFGAGPRVLFENKQEVGIRFPLGLAYLPHRTPFETFFELAPVLRLSPDAGLDVDFSLGVRYYFTAIRPRSGS